MTAIWIKYVVLYFVVTSNHFSALPHLILTALEHRHHYYT